MSYSDDFSLSGIQETCCPNAMRESLSVYKMHQPTELRVSHPEASHQPTDNELDRLKGRINEIRNYINSIGSLEEHNDQEKTE